MNDKKLFKAVTTALWDVLAEQNPFGTVNNQNIDYYIEKACKRIAPINISRPEAEVKAEAVKEFAEKIDLYLIKLFHQAHDSQKECEQHEGTVWENGWQRKDERMIMIQNDIQPFIRQLAEQFGKED